jgi:hypothetical protein
MGNNCVARLLIRKDARDPLMWNAAHLRALRSRVRVRATRILRCSGAQLQMRLLGNPSHNLH